MKISCADFTFPLLPHDRALQLIKLLGINAVDLGFFSGRSHLQPEHVFRDPSGAAKKFSARLESLGLEPADVFLQTSEHPSGLPANHPERAVRMKTRELVKVAIEFAAGIGCRHLTGLPGVLHENVAEQDSLKLAAEESVWRAETAAKSGLVYAIEPHVGSICQTPELVQQFLRLTPGGSLTLDYGHFIYRGFDNDAVHPLLPYATHFHARGGAPGRLQATMQENTIDFKSIHETMLAAGYTGYICLEYVWIDWEGCNRTDNISETIQLRELFSQPKLK